MARAAEHIPAPPNIRWLVELVGEDVALRLVEMEGGTPLYVPRKLTPDSELVRRTELEPAALEKLVRAHGGERVHLPLCREWRVRIYKSRDDQSYAQIARRVGMTISGVYRILNNSGMTAQLDLPLL